MKEVEIKRRNTRPVRAGDLIIGGGRPVSVQSMCATHTQDTGSTLKQIALLLEHGADLIRVAVDGRKDVEALKEIRKKTEARLVVDLQESYRLAESVAPFVQKIRYNPGHLHHHEKNIPVLEKVRCITSAASQHGCAVRIGINSGSIDPAKRGLADDPMEAALGSAREHIGYMKAVGFDNYLVSIKSSDPRSVVLLNRKFAAEFPDVPLHLGVTEAGMLPAGEEKTRAAFEDLLKDGIGETIRVSLTLPFDEKYKEVIIGRQILADIYAGRFRASGGYQQKGLNIISCPSCSRVENEAFVHLAAEIREMAQFAADKDITIAVMGCRVNGPGETDDADIGLWCAPTHVNLKLKGQLIGPFKYEEIVAKVRIELENLICGQ